MNDVKPDTIQPAHSRSAHLSSDLPLLYIVDFDSACLIAHSHAERRDGQMMWGTGPIVAVVVGGAIGGAFLLLLALCCIRWRMPGLYHGIISFLFPRTYIPSTPPAPPTNSLPTASTATATATAPSQPTRSLSRPRGRAADRLAAPPPYDVLPSQQRRGAILHLLDVIGRQEGDTVHEIALHNHQVEEERGRTGWTGRVEEVSPERGERRSMMEVMDDRTSEETPPKAPYGNETYDSVQSLGRPSTTAATMRSHDLE
ncbi:hypothetical protein CALCODRAFT_480724 [Calocera cornea HHB12733]|uniref:Uncharacterized protein n=1 Tax=Calocera cornea HHB12733 TaxID=1353952 RepID=A0A165IDR7_9BASI|nr:hypothetical protein CALCODRAFT_480724 [Calocera cornea HHB12733]